MKTLAKIKDGVISGILVIVIIGAFTGYSALITDNKLQGERISNNKEACQKNAENVEYLQKTLNVTNNNVTEIKVKIENLPTKSDIEELNYKLDRLHRKFDRNENLVSNE